MILYIFLQAQGGDLSSLVSLFKENAGILAGVGFVFYGLSVIKKVVGNHEKMTESIITYIIALLVFLGLWQLI